MNNDTSNETPISLDGAKYLIDKNGLLLLLNKLLKEVKAKPSIGEQDDSYYGGVEAGIKVAITIIKRQ